MANWLQQHICWITAISMAVLFCTAIASVWAVVRMPSEYFGQPHGGSHSLRHLHPSIRAALVGLRNAVGGLLVVIGLVLSLPLMPGPGLVIVVVGISMMNFPGKERLERWLLSRRTVLTPLNWLRSKWGRPPLQGPVKATGGDEPSID